MKRNHSRKKTLALALGALVAVTAHSQTAVEALENPVELRCTGTVESVQVRNPAGNVFIDFTANGSTKKLIAVCQITATSPYCDATMKNMMAALISRAPIEIVFHANFMTTPPPNEQPLTRCEDIRPGQTLISVTNPSTGATSVPLRWVSVLAPTN
jgi:hypothetical protein